jgi:hypothetical protein
MVILKRYYKMLGLTIKNVFVFKILLLSFHVDLEPFFHFIFQLAFCFCFYENYLIILSPWSYYIWLFTFMLFIHLCVASPASDILVIYQPHSHPHDVGGLILSLYLPLYFLVSDQPRGLVVRVSDYWSWGPGFDSRFCHGDFSLKGNHGLGSSVELRFKAPPGTSYSYITIHLFGTT